MIFFDVTKTGRAAHRSGLTRVSSRLREALGGTAREVTWDSAQCKFDSGTSEPPRGDDWLFTTELFSEEERPGLTSFLDAKPCRMAAVFHDAIPLKHPHITWPQSVARHPGYMKLLARFDRVWAVSQASREELLGFWRWQGLSKFPRVDVLALGADAMAGPRVAQRPAPSKQRPALLCVGIVEPRKNQSFLLAVCDELWTGGVDFELHLVGRVNPHFGRPIVREIETLQRRHRQRLQFHEAASDSVVTALYARARASLFPTLAEGCGLPLLESLWMGVPCVCSNLAVLRENADGGGCVPVAVNDRLAWKTALQQILRDDAFHAQLAAEALTRPLPTWQQAAATLAAHCAAPLA